MDLVNVTFLYGIWSDVDITWQCYEESKEHKNILLIKVKVDKLG